MKILTPDGNNILVGSSEDQILIYEEEFSNWNLKARQAAGSWSLKNKIAA